jgi:hypothetical protein
MVPLACTPDMERAHEELRAIGRAAGERTVRDVLRMELPIGEARDQYAQKSAVTQELIDAYMVNGQPALVAVVSEVMRHARQRIEELIREQQASEASAAAPS